MEYRYFMPNISGMKNPATSHMTRDADSSGRRIRMPQWPPVRCLQHEQTERTERKTEHGEKTNEVRPEKRFGRRDPSDDAANQAEHTDDKRALLEAADAFRAL